MSCYDYNNHWTGYWCSGRGLFLGIELVKGLHRTQPDPELCTKLTHRYDDVLWTHHVVEFHCCWLQDATATWSPGQRRWARQQCIENKATPCVQQGECWCDGVCPPGISQLHNFISFIINKRTNVFFCVFLIPYNFIEWKLKVMMTIYLGREVNATSSYPK